MEKDITPIIPNELWIDIFINLDRRDLECITLTSRKFHQISLRWKNAIAKNLLVKYGIHETSIHNKDAYASLLNVYDKHIESFEYFYENQRYDYMIDKYDEYLDNAFDDRFIYMDFDTFEKNYDGDEIDEDEVYTEYIEYINSIYIKVVNSILFTRN